MTKKADPSEVADWHRYFAIEGNNVGWRLSELAERTADQTEEMVLAAHASAFHWSQVGTELHLARARMLLGHVLAAAGQGAEALKQARLANETLSRQACPDWEIAFQHAILAHAAHAADEHALHVEEHRKARQAAEAIEDPEDRQVFDATFVRIPVP